MSKKDLLRLMRLLSALESWGFTSNNRLPDYLHDELCEAVTRLEAEILKDGQ